MCPGGAFWRCVLVGNPGGASWSCIMEVCPEGVSWICTSMSGWIIHANLQYCPGGVSEFETMHGVSGNLK